MHAYQKLHKGIEMANQAYLTLKTCNSSWKFTPHPHPRKLQVKNISLLASLSYIITPDRQQTKTLSTIDECGSKIDRNSVFYCHLSPMGRQMAIVNTVSIDFWSMFLDSIGVFDCRLSPFPAIHKFVVYFIICLCSLVSYIANNMNPDQTAPLGSSLIRVHSVCFHGKSILKCIWIHVYAADQNADNIFQEKNGSLRVSSKTCTIQAKFNNKSPKKILMLGKA